MKKENIYLNLPILEKYNDDFIEQMLTQIEESTDADDDDEYEIFNLIPDAEHPIVQLRSKRTDTLSIIQLSL